MGTDFNRPPKGTEVRAFLEGRKGDPTGMECPGAVEADLASTPVVDGGVETLVA